MPEACGESKHKYKLRWAKMPRIANTTKFEKRNAKATATSVAAGIDWIEWIFTL